MGGKNRFRFRAPATALTFAMLSAIMVAHPTPVSADVSTSYVITGGGWGHGLGMSQWGAKGFADQGWSATKIIEHFYTDTTVGTTSIPSSVRVGIAQNYRDITLIPTGDMSLKNGSTTLATARTNETWRIAVDTGNGALTFYRNGTKVAGPTGNASSTFTASWNSSTVRVKVPDTGNTYRWGPMELRTYSTPNGYRIRAVLVIGGFDHYLYGLGEVPSSWPEAALQAQVIAARTYAVEKIKRAGQHRSGCDCALYASTMDQAYVGYSKEEGTFGARWVNAVNAVAGKVALYNGAPIQAYYSSSDGGHSENNENVWGGSPVPYLRGVPDSGDSASPLHSWTVTYTPAALQSKLNAYSDAAVGILSGVSTLAPYGVSGRVLDVVDPTHGGVRIVGSSGTKRINGDRLQQILGLKSTKFKVTTTVAAPPVPRHATFTPATTEVGVFVAGGDVANAGRDDVVVGLDAGTTPTVRVFTTFPDGRVMRRASFDAYTTNFRGGVRVAVGDVDPATPGDEIVTIPGPGTWSRVRIWSLSGGLHMIKEFDPFVGSQRGGYVAVANTDGVGQEEIVTSTDAGGGGVVRAFRFSAGTIARTVSFSAFPTAPGGVRIAAGDVNKDGKAEIVATQGPGAAPLVKIFSGGGGFGRSFTQSPRSGYDKGAFVGMADVDGDDNAEVLVSFDAAAPVYVVHEAVSAVLHVSYLPFVGWNGGVRIAGFDDDADGKDELITAVGRNGHASIRVHSNG